MGPCRSGRHSASDRLGVRCCEAGATSARRWTASCSASARGESSVLVLRGEAGVGKTALLEYVAERASGCRIARVAGVESEMELAFAGLHQLCAPMLDGLEATARPAAGRAASRVRDAGRRCPGSLPRRPGGPEPAGRGGRGGTARVPGRRCAMARSGLRADAGVRRAAAAGGADRHGVRRPRARPTSTSSAACRSWSSGGSPTATHARCWRRPCRGGWTSACAIRSSPRRAATRWRCWSCRVG